MSIAFRYTAKQFSKVAVYISTSPSNVIEYQWKIFLNRVRVWLDIDVKLGNRKKVCLQQTEKIVGCVVNAL